MRLTLIHGVVGVVAFSVPAFASTSGTVPSEGVRNTLPQGYVQVATTVEEEGDGPFFAALQILERLGLEEGVDAIGEAQYRAESLARIGDPNVPDEAADENFRCAVMSAAGVPIKCVSYLP